MRTEIAATQGVSPRNIDWSQVPLGTAWRLAEEQLSAAQVPENIRVEYLGNSTTISTNSKTMELNPDNLPVALASLVPIAEKWGFGDDVEREAAIKKASQKELQELVDSIAQITDDDLYGWLSGPESFNSKPSMEYLAITCLTMAIDSAKLRLKELSRFD